MKKGCLIILIVLITPISFVIIYTVLFSKKPASEETKKDILFNEYNKIKNSKRLNRSIAAIKFLEKNKSVILDSLKTTNNNDEYFLDLGYYNENIYHLPLKLFNELPNILPKENYQLKITKDEKFLLINTITDYKNYLYIIHRLNKIDTLNIDNKDRNYTKTIILEDTFQYRLTIKDAFNDIDPNNFAPN